MRLLCPAKINLHLRIGPMRGDGFHPLLSWFCTAGLFDTLILTRADPANATVDNGSFISLTCDNAALPTDRRNLVVKIGDAWGQKAQRTDARVGPVLAELQKYVPAGAGLGGGSSDGARMLLGLDSLWKTGRAADYLSEFAARFGSDLPFFFFGASSICQGRGERVRPIPRPRPRWVLLILPAIVMPTAEVYRKFDAMGLGRPIDVDCEPDWLAWAKLDAKALLAELMNDLEAPAFAISPSLDDLRREIEKSLGRPVRMSGSGSSLFTLYDTADEASAARGKLMKIASLRDVKVEAVELAPLFTDDLNAPSESA